LPDFDAVGISHLGEVNRDVAVMRDRETAFGPSGQPRVWLGLVRVISRSATG
jgi:hypothetical protein